MPAKDRDGEPGKVSSGTDVPTSPAPHPNPLPGGSSARRSRHAPGRRKTETVNLGRCRAERTFRRRPPLTLTRSPEDRPLADRDTRRGEGTKPARGANCAACLVPSPWRETSCSAGFCSRERDRVRVHGLVLRSAFIIHRSAHRTRPRPDSRGGRGERVPSPAGRRACIHTTPRASRPRLSHVPRTTQTSGACRIPASCGVGLPARRFSGLLPLRPSAIADSWPARFRRSNRVGFPASRRVLRSRRGSFPSGRGCRRP